MRTERTRENANHCSGLLNVLSLADQFSYIEWLFTKYLQTTFCQIIENKVNVWYNKGEKLMNKN